MEDFLFDKPDRRQAIGSCDQIASCSNSESLKLIAGSVRELEFDLNNRFRTRVEQLTRAVEETRDKISGLVDFIEEFRKVTDYNLKDLDLSSVSIKADVDNLKAWHAELKTSVTLLKTLSDKYDVSKIETLDKSSLGTERDIREIRKDTESRALEIRKEFEGVIKELTDKISDLSDKSKEWKKWFMWVAVPMLTTLLINLLYHIVSNAPEIPIHVGK